MSHNINSIAYRGTTPWHSLGIQVQPGASIEQWLADSGLTWSAKKATIQYQNGILRTFEDQHVLYRSDTGHPFSVVSSRYQPVQPAEIVDFYRNLANDLGFEIETVGALGQGEKVWALARTPNSFALRGGDTVNDYLLLATSYDKSMATQAFFTSVRVVCNNTLQQSLNGEKQALVKVNHNSKFDARRVQETLGLHKSAWDEFGDFAKALSERRVTKHETVDVLFNLLRDEKEQSVEDWSPRKKNIAQSVFNCTRSSPGAHLPSADGTAWGLLNGITYYADHAANARTADNRLNSAWFGHNANLKQRAVELLGGLVDATPQQQRAVSVTDIFPHM